MRYPKEHKARSRRAILASALKLFAQRGFDNVSIDEIMADAGLTRGAFYAHFKNKQALYSEAISSSEDKPARWAADPPGGKSQLKRLVSDYLDADYSDPEVLCPLAYLVTDVANRELEVRAAYAESYQSLNSKIEQLMSANGTGTDGETVRALTAMMIGSVAIARAIPDPAASGNLMRGCKKFVLSIIDGA